MNAIIIQYDKRPNATIDEKLQSLIESIQLALNGMGEQDYVYQTSQDKGMEAVIVAIRQAEESISTNTSSIGNLGDRLDTAEGSLDTLEDTTIPGIQGDVSDLDGRLDTLEETTIPALDGRLDTLEGTVGGHTTDISGLDGRLDTLEDTTIPGIQGDVGDLDGRLDTLEGTVGGHTTDISGLDGRLDTLEDTTIPGIQGDISTLEDTTIPGIDTRVSALEGVTPAAPAVDGVYKLTVTVTNGEPVYTWEADE